MRGAEWPALPVAWPSVYTQDAIRVTKREPLIEARRLHVEYPPDRMALRGISFAIMPGETVGLLGESGCGKTTAALALLGLLPRGTLHSGPIFYKGRDLSGLSEAELSSLRGKEIALVFQEAASALHPQLTLGRQVAESARAVSAWSRTRCRAEASAALEAVGLPAAQFARAFPHQLSGGQLQRAQLAQALVCGPALLVADEPTAALDAEAEDGLLELIASLQRRHSAGILFISHDAAVLARCTHRLLVMYAGQIVESGPTAQLLLAPRHPYLQALLRSGDVSAGSGSKRRLETIPGDPSDISSRHNGCAFEPRCPRRMAICEQLAPPEVTGDGQVSCFLYVS